MSGAAGPVAGGAVSARSPLHSLKPCTLALALLLNAVGARAQTPVVQSLTSGTPLTSGSWTDSSVSVGTTAAVLLAANALRSGLVIANNGANLLCISLTGTASVSGSACGLGSIPVLANGVFSELAGTGVVSPQAVSAIALTSADNVTVWSK